MKKSLILLLGATLSIGACTAHVPGPGYYGSSGAVVVEDRPYYTHGPTYFAYGARYRWVGGHYVYRGGQRVWIHGRYVNRG